MPSQRRVEKLSTLIQEELSKIMNRDLEFTDGTLVTITRVTVSDDREYATVFISILGGALGPALEVLGLHRYAIQKNLNRKFRIRPVPKIRFTLDEGETRRESVEESLAKLKQKGEL